MIVHTSSDAEEDLVERHWFYERQSPGLGGYFRSCLIADIESLAYYGGIHELEYGLHRALSKRFPYCIYYRLADDAVTVAAILDARRDPSWTRQRLA